MAKGKKPSGERKAITSKIRANAQAANAAVRDAQSEARKAAKEARNIQRRILAKHGSDIREFRHAVAALKKAGIVSKRTDARKQEATAYMRKKVRDFYGIVVGTEQAIAVPKETRQQYKDSGAVKMKGRFAIIPRGDKDQALRIRKGMIEVTSAQGRPGPDGKRRSYMTEVILPFKMTDMEQVAERLQTDPTLDGLKTDGELFGARLYGHNIDRGMGWLNAKELGDHIANYYKHLLSGDGSQHSVRYFRLYRFWNEKSMLPEGPKSEKDYITDHNPNRRQRKKLDPWMKEQKDRRLAARKRTIRSKETEEETMTRLARQRARQASLRGKSGYARPDTKKPKGK